MEEFKGTKGNLRKAKSSRTKVEFSILREDGYQIALVESSYIGSDSETVANADLFIAAPELLNVLQETDKDLSILWSQVLFLEETNPIAEGLSDLIQKWRERNQQAINKALGINDKK